MAESACVHPDSLILRLAVMKHRTASGPDANDRKLALLLAALAFALYLPALFWGLPTGKAINGALQVLHGRVPYRDFWTMYAPGMFYLTAGVFKLLGREVVFQGAIAILIRAAIVGACFLLLRQLGSSRRLASVLAILFGGGLWMTHPEILSYHPALLLLLISLTLVARYYEHGGARRLVWTGVWVGLAACFKHDVAGYAVLAITIGLFVSWAAAQERRPDHWVNPVKATMRLALGTMAFFLPAAALVAWYAGHDAWQDLLVFPATDFRAVRGEHYASLLPPLAFLKEWLAAPGQLLKGGRAVESLRLWTLGNLPQWVFLVSLGVIILRRRHLPAAKLATAITLLAGIPFFWLAAHVQQNTHLHSMALLSMLLGSMGWVGLKGGARSVRWARAGLVCTALVYAVGLLLRPVSTLYLVRQNWSESQVLDLPGVRWIRLPRQQYEVYEPIARFLRQHTRSSEFIYVGVQRHDAIVINDPRFYYLADRLSCCRYSELHPGIIDRTGTQEEIINDIEDRGVRAAVIWKFGWSDRVLNQIMERRMAAVPGLGATLLDEYIAVNFAAVLERGEHRIMWRAQLQRPVEDEARPSRTRDVVP